MATVPQSVRKRVAVRPAAALACRPRLFAALELAFPVLFGPETRVAEPDAVVAVHESPSEYDAAEAPVPEILFVAPAARPGAVEPVRLLPSPALDRRLHGVVLGGQSAEPPLGDPVGAEVFAEGDGGVRWTYAPARDTHRVAGSLPELEGDEILRVALQNEHSLSIVAITHFLRALCAEADVGAPPLRAAIVFDDPNVRRRGYGWINYERLVTHADVHDYHAVMAMVPRDAVVAHPDTATLFRARADRISLAFHGNDHVKQELMTHDADRALALCAQARRRMAMFEARSGLQVDRVMTPPHGMCSERVASSLAMVGFDALCAIHPLPWITEPPGDQFLAGWEPATFAGPLAVIPRLPLDVSPTEIALRAFMDNPLVLYGHHDDLAAGLDVLEQAAARVNSLGDVTWMSLGSLALTNVARREEGDTLTLRPFSGRMRVRTAVETRQVIVEQPRGCGDYLVGWSSNGSSMHTFGAPVGCAPADQIEVCLRPQVEVDPRGVPAPPWRPHAGARRIATEARDRIVPLSRLLVT